MLSRSPFTIISFSEALASPRASLEASVLVVGLSALESLMVSTERATLEYNHSDGASSEVFVAALAEDPLSLFSLIARRSS